MAQVPSAQMEMGVFPDMTDYGVSVPVRAADGSGREALAVKQDLDGFEFKHSVAYSIITQKFGKRLHLAELKGLITITRGYLMETRQVELPPLSRNAKRSFPLLVKYVQDHADYMIPALQRIMLFDEMMRPVVNLDAL